MAWRNGTRLNCGTFVDPGDLLVPPPPAVEEAAHEPAYTGILNPGPDPDRYPGPRGGVGIPDDDDRFDDDE